MPKTSDYVDLDYCEHPAHQWPYLLDEVQKSGAKGVRSHVFWGVHETAPRICDFSRASQRGLERFLNQIKERELRVELCFGFPPCRKAFPNWAWGVEEASVVPMVFWDQPKGGFSFMKLPSLKNSTLFEGFLHFLRECFAVLELYTETNDTIQKIRMDFGVYAADANFLDPGALVVGLRERYGDIAKLNEVYGTSFSSFSSLEASSSYRVLYDRRPWLAAFDYHWCRSQGLVAYYDLIYKLAKERNLSKLMMSSLSQQAGLEGGQSWEIGFDRIQLDCVENNQFPLVSENYFHPSNLKSYRLWEYLKSETSRNDVGWRMLPLWEVEALDPQKTFIVIAGKFMTRASFASIERLLDQGGDVFFPFGLAKYDEQMESYDWPTGFSPAATSQSGDALLCASIGEGRVWIPSRSISVGQEMWQTIAAQSEFISNPGVGKNGYI